jgi:hypothetical protein
MNRSALFALAALALPVGAQAQHVSADIAIGGGPVAGRIIVGDPYYRHPDYYHRPVYREIIVVRGHRGQGWYRHRGYRQVRVYYDSGRDCFYDRPYYRGLRAIDVYHHDGRYYYDGDRYSDRDRYHRGDRDYDRDRYGRDRYDDQRNDYRRRVADRSDRHYDDDRH